MAALTAYASSALASEASSEAADAGAAVAASGAASEDLAESRPAGEEEPLAGNDPAPIASADVHLVAAGTAEVSSSDDKAAVQLSLPVHDTAEAAAVKAGDASPEPVPPGVEGLGQTARAEAAAGDEAADTERSQAAAPSSGSAGADQELDGTEGGIFADAPQALHAVSEQAHAPSLTAGSESGVPGPLPVFGPPPRPLPLPLPPIVFPAAVLPPPAAAMPLPGLRPSVHPASMPVPPASSTPTSSPSAETVAIMDKLIRYIKVRSSWMSAVLQRTIEQHDNCEQVAGGM